MTGPSPLDRLRLALRGVAYAIPWLAVATVIALGGAGLVASLDHDPGTAARPELTWTDDARVLPALEAATEELRLISSRVDALGVQGRGALAALVGRDFDTLETAIGEGATLVADVRERSTALRARLAAIEGLGPGAELRHSADVRERHARLVEAAASTEGLAEGWARLSQGGLAAARLSALLGRHDELIAAAIGVGREGDFESAITQIDEATAALDEAQRLRDQLANTVDVATLDEWLRRSRNYGAALRALYVATAESPNAATDGIRAATEQEREARAALPRNTNALAIIMADIAQGGLNQAVIAIEEARGRLAESLELVGAESPTEATPGG